MRSVHPQDEQVASQRAAIWANTTLQPQSVRLAYGRNEKGTEESAGANEQGAETSGGTRAGASR